VEICFWSRDSSCNVTGAGKLYPTE
jgi:hypothetical protein